jgi:hypothetical protein
MAFGASAPTMIREIGLALDSALVGGGFEPSVPLIDSLQLCARQVEKAGRKPERAAFIET